MYARLASAASLKGDAARRTWVIGKGWTFVEIGWRVKVREPSKGGISGVTRRSWLKARAEEARRVEKFRRVSAAMVFSLLGTQSSDTARYKRPLLVVAVLMSAGGGMFTALISRCSERRHECRSSTQECVRHTLSRQGHRVLSVADNTFYE